MKRNNKKTVEDVKIMARNALFSALLAILSQLAFPIPSGLPITLQTFAVCLCGYFLGVKGGLCSVGVYILLGVCGLPVFAGFSGGIGHISGVTGGFVVGFLFLVVACGMFRPEKHRYFSAICAGIAGTLMCHISGVLWYSRVAGIGMIPAFIASSAPFIVKDVISCIAAYFLCRAVAKRSRRR